MKCWATASPPRRRTPPLLERENLSGGAPVQQRGGRPGSFLPRGAPPRRDGGRGGEHNIQIARAAQVSRQWSRSAACRHTQSRSSSPGTWSQVGLPRTAFVLPPRTWEDVEPETVQVRATVGSRRCVVRCLGLRGLILPAGWGAGAEGASTRGRAHCFRAPIAGCHLERHKSLLPSAKRLARAILPGVIWTVVWLPTGRGSSYHRATSGLKSGCESG